MAHRGEECGFGAVRVLRRFLRDGKIVRRFGELCPLLFELDRGVLQVENPVLQFELAALQLDFGLLAFRDVGFDNDIVADRAAPVADRANLDRRPVLPSLLGETDRLDIAAFAVRRTFGKYLQRTCAGVVTENLRRVAAFRIGASEARHLNEARIGP